MHSVPYHLKELAHLVSRMHPRTRYKLSQIMAEQEGAQNTLRISQSFNLAMTALNTAPLDPDFREYVVGVCLSEDKSNALFVIKNRPEWQAGKFNGAGGKIEPGEKPHEAMVREFNEETGVLIESWDYLALQKGDHYALHVFGARSNKIFAAKQMTDERIIILPVNNLDPDLFVQDILLFLNIALSPQKPNAPIILDDYRPSEGQ